MFGLIRLEDAVRVIPADLGKPLFEAVQAVLERTYLDKVIPDVGLVVTIYDLQDITGGLLHHSDGAAHYQARFRLVVFRPFPGEVLKGRVSKSTEAGIWLSLKFFEDVFVPEEHLQEASAYKPAEHAWCWQTEGGDLWLDKGEEVLFRVKELVFNKLPTTAEIKAASGTEPGVPTIGSVEEPFVPMQVVGSIQGDGLGCVAWWPDDTEEDDMAG